MNHNWKPGNGTIAFLIACVTAILLTATAPAIGLTWDEPAYIWGASSKAAWLRILVTDPAQAFKPITIDNYWIALHEDPPVEIIWSGLVAVAARHVFDELTANRLGAMLMVALLVALLYLMVAETYGKLAGLFAVTALLSMPRFFFHAHLEALDVPVATASFATTFLFWKTVDRKGWAWGLLLGLIWGLAVAIKLNGVFVPIAFILWFVIFQRKWSVVLRLFLMGGVAVLTFFIVWPWLYHQTWMRVLEYINFELYHYPLGQWYLGQFYIRPPWHYVFVILWSVVPLTVMVLFLAGIARAVKGKRDGGLGWLLILSVFASISPFIFGRNLAYDGERLFMPVFPFLAALAGIGFGWLVGYITKLMERINRSGLAIPVTVILGLILLTPQSVIMADMYPHLLSYYSEGVGGLPGATKLGLETTYWSETYAAALPYINAHANPGDITWVENNDVLLYYQRIGKLRPDVTITNSSPDQSFMNADWIIVQYRQTWTETIGKKPLVVQSLETKMPVYEVSYQGVPLMILYHAQK